MYSRRSSVSLVHTDIDFSYICYNHATRIFLLRLGYIMNQWYSSDSAFVGSCDLKGKYIESELERLYHHGSSTAVLLVTSSRSLQGRKVFLITFAPPRLLVAC